MTPRVSLAIPVYNGANFIGEALESLLSQTFRDLEIVISDNASTDSTPGICRSFAERDARIRYCRLPRNIGAGPNFNHAFRLGRGEFFKWCAHDDLISPEYVERCIATLERRPDAVLAFGRTICIDENGAEIEWKKRRFMPPLEHEDPAVRLGVTIRSAETCFPIFGLFRADALRRSTLRWAYYGTDRALLAEIALLGKVVLVEEALFYNRDHGKRSVMIESNDERMRWHNASAGRWQSLPHINFLVHLIKIARRHGDVASPAAALGEIARAAFTPRQLGRLCLDLVRIVSPSAGDKLKRAWRSVFRSNRRMRVQ